jgi:hypothetical protein
VRLGCRWWVSVSRWEQSRSRDSRVAEEEVEGVLETTKRAGGVGEEGGMSKERGLIVDVVQREVYECVCVGSRVCRVVEVYVWVYVCVS